MSKSYAAVALCLTLAVGGSLALTGCRVTRKPDGTIIAEPADGGTPRKLPPERVRRIEINGKCYFQFMSPNGVWYCFPCDLEGSGYAEPCDSIINPQANLVDESESLGEFIMSWLEKAGIEPTSEGVLGAFGIDVWEEGDPAPVPLAIMLLDTDEKYVEVVIVSRSDWDWPDSSGVTLQCFALPDATGGFPDPTDDQHDALIFRVSGSFHNVAEAVSGFFVSGFSWKTTYDGSQFLVESERINSDTHSVIISQDGNVVWSNQ